MRGDGDGDGDMNVDDKPSGSSTAPPPPPKARATAADLERTGLCVICQDDEANIAIVDCGYVLPVIPQMSRGLNLLQTFGDVPGLLRFGHG